MDNDLSTIGKRIGHYRRMNNMSAEELAGKMSDGLTRAVITNLENGRKTDVTVTQLVALSSALGVPPVALAFDVTKPWQFHDLRSEPETGVRHHMATWVILDWFSGQGDPRFDLLTPAGRETHALLARLRTYKRRQLQKVELEDEIATLGHAGDPEHLAELENELSKVRRSLNVTAKMLSVSFGVDVTQRDQSTRYNSMNWEQR